MRRVAGRYFVSQNLPVDCAAWQFGQIVVILRLI